MSENREFFEFCDKFTDRIQGVLREELLVFYARNVHPRHFDFDNMRRYGYKPLSARYLYYKIKKYGIKPILVASGRLSKSSFKISNGRLLFSMPQYAKYVRRERDFFKLAHSDRKDIVRALKTFIKKKRKENR